MKHKKGGGKNFQGKETFQRMNFLYQAAHVLLANAKETQDTPSYYGSSMLAIAQKSVLKMEPNIKRDICKGCGTILKPGVTVKVRLRTGTLIYSCLRCGTIKRFPTKRGYKLWIESDEACVEVIEVSNTANEASMPPKNVKDGNCSSRQKEASEGTAVPDINEIQAPVEILKRPPSLSSFTNKDLE